MGVEISETNVVSITDKHENVARTSASYPPHQICLGISGPGPKLRVSCIFPRAADDGAAALAWAIKGLRGYSVDAGSRREMLRRAIEIGSRTLQPGDADVIVPMPSNGPVVARMCGVLQRRLHCPVLPALRKLTIGEAMWLAPRPSKVPKRLRGCFVRQLQAMGRGDPAAPIQAKSISVMIRRYFPVVIAATDVDLSWCCRALLVDDILSTGSTFYLGRPQSPGRGPAPRNFRSLPVGAGRKVILQSDGSIFASAFTRLVKRRRAAGLGIR